MGLAKDYKGFMCNILGYLEDWSLYEKLFSQKQKLPNIINGCVFIVQDKDKFIKNMSNTLFDKCDGSLNPAPQSARGNLILILVYYPF